MMSVPIPNAISSQAPGPGALPQGYQDGMTIALSGPPPARASRSAPRAAKVVQMIQGTYGRTYIESFAPDFHQDSPFLFWWENRLRERLAMLGSTEFALIWRKKTSPQGRSISRLARSTVLMNGTDSGGSPSDTWRTPTAGENRGGAYADPAKALARIASGHTINLEDQMVGLWPTPNVPNGGRSMTQESATTGKKKDGSKAQINLESAVKYWPTPKASIAGESSRSGDRSNEPLMGGLMREAIWSTPRASDGEKGGPNMSFGAGGTPLPTQMYWVTPAARDWKGSRSPNGAKHLRPGGPMLNEQMVETGDLSGTTRNSSHATTAKRGAPNPAFPCWLMGWSDELVSGVLSGIASSRSSRLKSCRRSSKLKA